MSRPTIQTSISTLRDVFEARATMCPGRRAIFSTESGWISYASLDSVANGLAADLHRLGVGRGDRVAILLPRSAPAIEAILAVWKVGASYIPVDPRGPTAQRDYVLNDAAPVIAIGDRRLGGELPSSVRCYDLSQEDARPAPGTGRASRSAATTTHGCSTPPGPRAGPRASSGRTCASLRRCEWMWRAQPSGPAKWPCRTPPSRLSTRCGKCSARSGLAYRSYYRMPMRRINRMPSSTSSPSTGCRGSAWFVDAAVASRR